MRRGKKKHADHGVSEKWAIPYADFLSLLLALFIALYAISAQNKAKVEALKKEFLKIFDYPELAKKIPPTTKNEPFGKSKEDVRETSSSASPISLESVPQFSRLVQEGVALEQIERGIKLELPSSLNFHPNVATIDNHEMRDYIRDIARIIKQLPDGVKINVRGFTDNSALPMDSLFPDHFSLGSERAKNVANLLIENGVDPKKISMTSFGANSPLYPNTSVENRARNNRVEIFISTDENAVDAVKSVLDSNR